MICKKCGSEVPDGYPYCSSNQCLTREILKIERNEKGGFFTYFEGSKYPLPFCPKRENLNYIDTLKKVIISSLRLVYSFPVTPKRLIIGIQTWLSEIYAADTAQNPNRFVIQDLNEAAQEILRCLILIDKSGDTRWCWYLAAIWDTDLAYGLRGKDILQLLDKKALKYNPKYEIIRLFDITIARDFAIQPKLKMVRRMLKLALLSKEIREMAVTFLENLDIEKMKFDINEKYWLANKFDYNYEGKTYEERMAWRDKEDEDYVAPEILKEQPRIAINPPNQAFYELNQEEASKMIGEVATILRDNWIANQKNANSTTKKSS